MARLTALSLGLALATAAVSGAVAESDQYRQGTLPSGRYQDQDGKVYNPSPRGQLRDCGDSDAACNRSGPYVGGGYARPRYRSGYDGGYYAPAPA